MLFIKYASAKYGWNNKLRWLRGVLPILLDKLWVCTIFWNYFRWKSCWRYSDKQDWETFRNDLCLLCRKILIMWCSFRRSFVLLGQIVEKKTILKIFFLRVLTLWDVWCIFWRISFNLHVCRCRIFTVHERYFLSYKMFYHYCFN